METQVTGRSKRQTLNEFIKRLFILTIGGGVIFWATTIATSLLPIAAEYRAAFSNWSIQAVWIDSLIVGLIIGCYVSFSLLRFIDKNPTKSPILKSLIQSLIALIIVTLLIDVPRSIFGQNHAVYYFFIGLIFNFVRFLFLGLAIGYLYKRLYGSARTDRNKFIPSAVSSGIVTVDLKKGDKK
jgi:hypothetical protein